MLKTLADLRAADEAHLIHPLYSLASHRAQGPIILVRGRGAILEDAGGKTYIDGLSSLWNVNCGHGRVELGEAAARQMSELAFASAYTGLSNIPAIELASKLAEIAYPRLNTVFFASGGAEANESAFKTARFYWKALGRPDKIKIIARNHAYHGVTLAAMSATGISAYWSMFEPRSPGFVHIEPPYRFRYPENVPVGQHPIDRADNLEEAILSEGPETVAAFIAEPVQGAGGVIPPPDGYFQRVREICDRYEVLFIADEVITGFGRTGRWFALEHWGVEPDIMSFAKGVTSAYVPLGGIMLSDDIADVLKRQPADKAYMHAYTYSGHPTTCAVGLANLAIFEREGLVARAERVGNLLQEKLRTLMSIPIVGEVRGLGMMAAIELAQDRASRSLFPASDQIGARVIRLALERGVLTRARGDVIFLAPPLVTTEEELDRLVQIIGESIDIVSGEIA
ncbi:MAG TPA: aspartate aminotransferase family protein [Chloroflexota bacterium]|nr:aspartate aminotransferase family protein [Chloroflexota bacterium]